MPEIVFKLIRLLIYFFSCLYFVPVTIVFTVLLKHSNNSSDFVEFSNNDSSNTFQYGILGVLAAIFLLFLHLLIGIVYEGIHFQTRHAVSLIDLQAKSSARVEILIKLIIFTCCLMYVFMIQSYYIGYLLVLEGFDVIILANLVIFLPFYNPFMNYLKGVLFAESFFINVFFIIANLMNEGTITFVLTVCMQPVIVVMTLFVFDYRISKIKPLNSSLTLDFNLFELSARPYLINGELEEEILRIFNKNHTFAKNKNSLVLQADYCNDILNNPMLAAIKISRTSHFGLDLCSNFQVFRCKENLNKINSVLSEGFKLYNYLCKIKKVKKEDKNLCEELLKFVEKIVENRSSLSGHKQRINNISKQIKSLNSKYLALLSFSPDSITVLGMYGSLLSNILGKTEQGDLYENKKNRVNLSKSRKRKECSVNVEERGCVLIVSGNQKTIGKILYANSNMLVFLDTSQSIIEESYLSQFIPKPFDTFHDEFLLNFVINSTSHQALRRTRLFILNYHGFLVECYFNSECVGFEGSHYFISEIEPITTNKRELALIDLAGTIFCHSQNFPGLLGVKEKKIESLNICDVILGVDLQHPTFNV